MTHFSYKVTHFRRLSKVVQSMILHKILILKSENICFWRSYIFVLCKIGEILIRFLYYLFLLPLFYIPEEFNFKLICRLWNIISSKFIVILYVFFYNFICKKFTCDNSVTNRMTVILYRNTGLYNA